MNTVKILKSDTKEVIPAEVRSIQGDNMTVLMKNFHTAKMDLITLVKTGENEWTNGTYSCQFSADEMTATDKLVRVPKK